MHPTMHRVMSLANPLQRGDEKSPLHRNLMRLFKVYVGTLAHDVRKPSRAIEQAALLRAAATIDDLNLFPMNHVASIVTVDAQSRRRSVETGRLVSVELTAGIYVLAVTPASGPVDFACLAYSSF